ncbi:exported hypothetical protein [Thiomonas sp. CB3]|nr:exported hypothetical protein [Thiomonas sp. CB3]
MRSFVASALLATPPAGACIYSAHGEIRGPGARRVVYLCGPMIARVSGVAGAQLQGRVVYRSKPCGCWGSGGCMRCVMCA